MKLLLDSFFEKFEEALALEKPFVVYRKPNKKLLSGFIQKTTEVRCLDNFNQKGFVFSPFDTNEEKILFELSECDLYKTTIQNDFKIKDKEEKFLTTENSLEKENHIALVGKTVEKIKSGRADKIVVSRKEKIETTNFKVFNTYKKLLQNYPKAFVYVWFHPKIGCWMGASPERLINIKNNVFKTMALAGTQVYKNTLNVVWKEKEIIEQQFVTDYILNNIKDVLKGLKVGEPYTVKAGNLVHLRTDIEAEINSSKELEKLVTALHPTPAVCGIPKEYSKSFILENEHYNRAFYTGYLGELNIESNTSLFVNLRCMQILKNAVNIYVGGGITKESVPINEWLETVAKTKVMKKVL